MKASFGKFKVLSIGFLSAFSLNIKNCLAQGFNPIGVWRCEIGVRTVNTQTGQSLATGHTFNMQVNRDGTSYFEGVNEVSQTPFRGQGNWNFQGNTFAWNGTMETRNIYPGGIDLGTSAIPFAFTSRVHTNPHEMVAADQLEENMTMASRCIRLQ